MNQQLWGQVALALVFVGLLAFRLMRMRRSRPLKLERLWIVPALFGAGLVLALAFHPPVGASLLWIAGALLIGGLAGWWRGRLMVIRVDPATHALNQNASPVAIIVLLLIVAARRAMSAMLVHEGKAWAIDPLLLGDISLAFAFGLLALTRLEMGLRARRMLREAQRGSIIPRS